MRVLVLLCFLAAVVVAEEYAGAVTPAPAAAHPYQAGVLQPNAGASDPKHGVIVMSPNGNGDVKACACLGQPACPCNKPTTCCKAADTCHASVPKCSVVKATEVPKGSLAQANPSCCPHTDACHPSVPKCPAPAAAAAPAPAAPAAPAAHQPSITSDAAVPDIKWGQLPPNMAPVKVIGAQLKKDACGCLHLDTCACRGAFTTPLMKDAPCTCHSEPECPCAAAVQHEDTSCCPAEAQCHPAMPKCGASVQPEVKLESNCCDACNDKPKCPEMKQEAPKCSCQKKHLVEAEAVDHLCPCAQKMHLVEAEEAKPKCCSAEPCHAAVPKCSEASDLANGKNVAIVHGNVVHPITVQQ